MNEHADTIRLLVARLATGGTQVCSFCNASDVTDDGHRGGCPVPALLAEVDALVAAMEAAEQRAKEALNEADGMARAPFGEFKRMRERMEAAEQRADQAEREEKRWYEHFHTELQRADAAVARADALTRRCEEKDEAIRTALDLITGWSRPMPDDDRAELIERTLRAALSAAEGDATGWQYTSEPAPDPHALCCRSCREHAAAVPTGEQGDGEETAA